MKVWSQAPLRISLVGGGSDTEPYVSEYGGLVLNFAINIYQTVILGGQKKLLENDDPKFFEAFEEHFKHTPIEHLTNGFMESGLGSSASLAVALTAAFYKAHGKKTLDKLEIAKEAQNIEVNRVGLFGGIQDQLAASFGGINLFSLSMGRVERTPLDRSFLEPILPSMVLVKSGVKRTNPKIQEGLKTLTNKQIQALDITKAMVPRIVQYIIDKDIESVGRALHEAWIVKQETNKVATDEILLKYEQGISAGSWGGKLCGSGMGGCFLFIVPEEKRKSFLEETKFEEVDFDIAMDGVQTRRLE